MKLHSLNAKSERLPGINRSPIILLTVLYTIILLWVVVLKCNMSSALNTETVEWRLSMPLGERFTRYLIPFESVYEELFVHFYPSSIVVFFLNLICFIPLGMLLGFFGGKLFGFISSGTLILGIEFFQLFTGWGLFDSTDIITNLLGVYLGFLIFDLLYKRLSADTVNKAVRIALSTAVSLSIFVILHTALRFPL